MNWYSDYLLGVSKDFAGLHKIYRAKVGARTDDLPANAARAMHMASAFGSEDDVFIMVEHYAKAVLMQHVPTYPPSERRSSPKYSIADYAAKVDVDPTLALRYLPEE